MDCSWMEGCFDNLKPGTYEGKSVATPDYNCIAYAAGSQDKPWWPDAEIGGYYWPESLPRQKIGEETMENFVSAFELQGYHKCLSGELEEGFEKVAIYISSIATPTHAARQRSDGVWVSKIGDEEDIEHQTLEGLEGKEYGKVAQFLRRPIRLRVENHGRD